ncbi:MAG: trigger factor [Methylovulum sp.]|jgi:trigger factor|nr:trigger factor [Methylovulum sp.]
MQISVEKTSELSRKMTVSLPEAVVQEKMAERFKSLAQKVKVDGFRPGKVPHNVIKKMYSAQVRQEVAGDLIESTYFKAIQEQNLNPVSQPFINTPDDAPSEGFEYTAVFEVYPEIPLAQLAQLDVIKPISHIEETDIDEMIEKLRHQKAQWIEINDRPSQEKDQLTINFTGTLNEEKLTDDLVENYAVVIGNNQMIPGFEDNLIGLDLNATKTFDLSFPEDYGNEKLAGQTAQFEVTVTKIEASIAPEIDEDFIKSYGLEEGSIAAFREDVKANMERELTSALRNKLKDAVMAAINQRIQLTLPNALVDEEVENLMKPYIDMAKKQKSNLDDLDITRHLFIEKAKERISLGLILSEIIHKNEIVLNEDKVKEKVEDLAKSYEDPQQVIDWYYADKKRLNDIHQVVLEEQTVDFLLAQSIITEQHVEFKDVMNKQRH